MWRFVDGLIGNRSPKPFRAQREDEAELRTAITLRAASEDAGAARPEFVDTLRTRLAEQLAEPDARRGRTRRRFVQAMSAAAAAMAAGFGLDRFLLRGASQAPPVAAQQTVTPDTGEWRAVAASTDLPDGGVRPFDLGSVNGFVQRTGGRLLAVSGVCTHLGCRLTLNAPQRQLNCPCHNASFAVTGEVLHHYLPIELRPLPRLPVREVDGVVQVYAPPQQA